MWWSARRAAWAPFMVSLACTAPNPAFYPDRDEDAAAPLSPDTARPDGPRADAAALLDLAHRPLAPDAPSERGLAPPDAAPDAPPRVTGLVGYWQFEDDPAGMMARDSSGNEHHGRLENLGLAAWTPGQKLGTALMFPPLAAGAPPPGVRIPATPAIDGLRAFTISVWFRRTAVPANTHDSVISRQLGTGNAEVFNVTCNNHDLIVYIPAEVPGTGSQTTYEARASNIAVMGRWIHAAATYDGTTLRLYADGRSVATRTFANRLRSSPGAPIYIGANVNMGFVETFEGLIDEVALFSVALPEADIVKLATGATPFQL